MLSSLAWMGLIDRYIKKSSPEYLQELHDAITNGDSKSSGLNVEDHSCYMANFNTRMWERKLIKSSYRYVGIVNLFRHQTHYCKNDSKKDRYLKSKHNIQYNRDHMNI